MDSVLIFRCSSELRNEIETLGRELDLPYSQVIRWLLCEALGITRTRRDE